MKLKITEPGWATFSDVIGGIEFKDGVSVHDVAPARAIFLATLMNVEWLEDGTNPGINANYKVALEVEAKTVYFKTHAELEAEAKAEGPVEEAAPVAPLADPVWHTQESLEAVADQEGIEGLRKIADPMGLKANSIVKLIKLILQTQTNPVPSTPPAVEAPVDESPVDSTEG